MHGCTRSEGQYVPMKVTIVIDQLIDFSNEAQTMPREEKVLGEVREIAGLVDEANFPSLPTTLAKSVSSENKDLVSFSQVEGRPPSPLLDRSHRTCERVGVQAGIEGNASSVTNFVMPL
jgi:hypothetical protein